MLQPAVASPPASNDACVSGQNRKRGRAEQASSPLRSLLEQIRRLKLPSIDAATADQLLAPFCKAALQFDSEGMLLAILQQFGWEAGGFTKGVDLGSFSLLLQVTFASISLSVLPLRCCQEGRVNVFGACSGIARLAHDGNRQNDHAFLYPKHPLLGACRSTDMSACRSWGRVHML